MAQDPLQKARAAAEAYRGLPLPGPRSQPGRPARQEYSLTEEEWTQLNYAANAGGDTMRIWQVICDKLGIAPLTVSWPDTSLPEFTARPR